MRTNKGVKLTPDGEKLYEHISIAFEHIQAGEAEISMNRSLENGIITIGASEIALRSYLLPILNKYHQLYPGIRIKISNVSTPQALTMLKNRLVDLAFVTTPLDHEGEVTEKKLKSFREVPICGEAFKELSEKEKPLSLKELSQLPIIALGPKTSTFDFYFRQFLKQGCTFAPDIEAATADQIMPLVEHNLGIGFVPEDFLLSQAENVYEIPLDTPIEQRHISLVKKKGRTPSLPAKELEKMLTENIK